MSRKDLELIANVIYGLRYHAKPVQFTEEQIFEIAKAFATELHNSNHRFIKERFMFRATGK